MQAHKLSVLFLTALLSVSLCAGAESTVTPAPASVDGTSATVSQLPPAPTYADRYWKRDAKSSEPAKLPSNYRTMEDAFRKSTEGMDLEVLRAGLDTARLSGSGQYGAASFAMMIEDIRTRTDGEICVFDLRQETHGFANGTAVSLYASRNAGNAGLDVPEVTELEQAQLSELLGTVLTLTSDKKGKPGADGATAAPAVPEAIGVSEIMTEAELCASLGVRYVRIACTDHLCPEDPDVDDFMTAYLSLPEGTWLHFHCAAGVGRTGLFMMMADMLRCPDVPLDTIIERQSLYGASDPRDPDGGEAEESDSKLDLLQRFYDYVQACRADGFTVTFSRWSAARAGSQD